MKQNAQKRPKNTENGAKSGDRTIPEQFSSKKPRKPKLPKYVTKKYGEYIVRRCFPTSQRDKRGRIVYIQLTEPWYPQTEERAKEISDEIEATYNQELAADAASVDVDTLDVLIKRVLHAKRKAVAPRTFSYYSKLYKRGIKGRPIALLPIEKVTTLVLQDHYDTLGEGENAMSPGHIRKLHVFLSMVFVQAINWDLAKKNPTAGVMQPKSSEKETAAFNEAEAARFMAVCLTRHRFIKFALDLATGLRPQEVMALPVPNLDIVRRRIRIDQALADEMPGGGFEIKEVKTKFSNRTVRFSEELVEPLKDYLKHRKQWIASLQKLVREPLLLKHMKRMGVNYQKRKSKRIQARETLARIEGLDLLFPSANGNPQSIANANRRDFRDALELAGLDPSKFTFTSLRHTNLSLLAEKIGPKRLQIHAGHERIETTMRYYVHVTDDSQDEVPEKLRSSLFKRVA